MFEIKLLSICDFDEVVELYKQMVLENKLFDRRLAGVEVDDRTIRNILQFSFDIENDLLYVAFFHNKPVGFIDSTRLVAEGKDDEWYIKSVYLDTEYRDPWYFEQLVQKVEREVRQRGITVIFSNALIDNREINTLWEGIGYTLRDGRREKEL